MRYQSLTLLFFALLSLNAFATHLVGGEMFYEHLGNDVYGITLKVYRDCGPTNTNDTQYDEFASVGVFVNQQLYTDLSLAFDEAIVTSIPVVLENPCFVLPPDVCVEEAIYYGEAFLPFGPDYEIIYERCCRNPSISNILFPDDTGATFITTVPGDGLVSEQNSGAAFNNFPPVALCAGAEFFFDHSATDLDNDLLTYDFCTPYVGGAPDLPQPVPPNGPPYANVQWAAGFNPGYQIAADPAFEIDSQTGQITGTPSTPGQYVIGVCVTEWRNGIPINVTNRDFQFNVTLCDPTIIAAIPEQTLFCDGLTFEFNNESINGEFFFWDFGDPTTELDTSTVASPTYTYADTGQYVVTLIANPGWNCADTSAQLYAAYPLIVPDIIQLDSECINDQMLYNFESSGQYDTDAEFLWEFTGADIATAAGSSVEDVHFFDAESYTVSLTVFDNGCDTSTTETFTAPPQPVASITTQSLFCQGFQQEFDNNSTNADSYFWNFGDLTTMNDVSSLFEPLYTYPDTGTYTVRLIAAADATCPDTTFSTFDIQFLLDPFFESPGSACFDGNSFDFQALGWEDSNTQFEWQFGENASPSVSTLVSPQNVSFSQPGGYNIILTATVHNCVQSFNEVLNVIPNPTIDFEFSGAEGCPPLAVSFLESTTSASPLLFEWQLGDGTESFVPSPTHIYEYPGYYDVTLTVQSTNGCVQTLTETIPDAVRVYPIPKAGFDIEPNTVNFLEPHVQVTDFSENAVEVNFSFGDGGFSQEREFEYTFSEAGYIPVQQTVFNEFGCKAQAIGEVAVEGFVLYAPNAFTPNGDQINDVFLPEMSGVTKYRLEIYNRWGELIFETEDQETPWLGQVKGDNHFAQDDVYLYRIFVEDLLSYPHEFEGHITLIR